MVFENTSQVSTATHEEGALLDPVFASYHFKQNDLHIDQQCVYYSDHDLIHVKIKIHDWVDLDFSWLWIPEEVHNNSEVG